LIHLQWLQLTNTITFEICHWSFESASMHANSFCTSLKLLTGQRPMPTCACTKWGPGSACVAEQLLCQKLKRHWDVVTPKESQQARRTADLHQLSPRKITNKLEFFLCSVSRAQWFLQHYVCLQAKYELVNSG
jgi:hypothetical protein